MPKGPVLNSAKSKRGDSKDSEFLKVNLGFLPCVYSVFVPKDNSEPKVIVLNC